jgi:hypothetical protein
MSTVARAFAGLSASFPALSQQRAHQRNGPHPLDGPSGGRFAPPSRAVSTVKHRYRDASAMGAPWVRPSQKG